jgi:uncharacterized tellurite resistance protein B-like protein
VVAEAIKAEHEAVDLYHFASLINRSLDENGRRRIVEMMWEIITPGRITEFENNVMRRTYSAFPSASASSLASASPAGA